jgi:hypothetical protein
MIVRHADFRKEDARQLHKKSRSGMTPRGLRKRLPVSRFRRCIHNRRAAQRFRARTKKKSHAGGYCRCTHGRRAGANFSIALCCWANVAYWQIVLQTKLPIRDVRYTVAFGGKAEVTGTSSNRRDWPPIKIVATSGIVDVRKVDLPKGGRFLPKPYSSAEIIWTLRELTGAEPRA